MNPVPTSSGAFHGTARVTGALEPFLLERGPAHLPLNGRRLNAGSADPREPTPGVSYCLVEFVVPLRDIGDRLCR